MSVYQAVSSFQPQVARRMPVRPALRIYIYIPMLTTVDTPCTLG